MAILYRIIIFFYGLMIRTGSLFNTKARSWVKGRKNLFRNPALSLKKNEKKGKIIWFHCASLGEFEQGRPVMEEMRRRKPGSVILLTFFSPSGYEIRKNYTGADFVTYLPLDTPANARRFLDIIKPDIALFVKYEFWYFFLRELNKRNIPVFLISAIFRPDQLFFRRYGRFYLKILHLFTGIFVQDQESKQLLARHGITQVETSGDTRYDRVKVIASKPRRIPVAKTFATGHTVVVAGSTWPDDENILLKYILSNNRPYRWIIAPHEIHESHLSEIKTTLGEKAEFFSRIKDLPEHDINVLIIDNVGMLSSLYVLADIAYIGGGFGKGIHNILEAAVFGIPVIFGPNYKKFREANELAALKTAFPVSSYDETEKLLNRFFDDPGMRKSLGEKNRHFINSRTGATEQIVNNMLRII